MQGMNASVDDNQQNESNSTRSPSNQLDHLCSLDFTSKSPRVRMTGIICTIGPSSSKVEVLEKMIETGMNVARLNFSHGSYEYHGNSIASVRQAVENVSNRFNTTVSVAIALDTKGPEIRTGPLEGGPLAEVELKKGRLIKVTTDPVFFNKGSSELIYVDYPNMCKVVHVEGRIYMDDGLISLVVKEIGNDYLLCEIENGGPLGSQKGVNLPGTDVDMPAITEKDKSDIRFGVEQGVDMIFASFARNAAAIHEIRQILGEKGSNMLIISKIENHQGIQNLDEIIEASDGIMVARSDLGIELQPEKVFLAQKTMIARCNKAGKPVICATQTLDSMIRNPRATRIESSDIANSILDGADCVMLSGETAKGDYPIEAVRTMANIAEDAEAAKWQRQLFLSLSSTATNCLADPGQRCSIGAMTAVDAAFKHEAAAIIALTTTGITARLIAKFRPHCPIIAVTRDEQVARQCHLWRGIYPFYQGKVNEGSCGTDGLKDVDARVLCGINFGRMRGFIRTGDPIIVITGWKQGAKFTNNFKLVYVGND